MTSRPSTVRQLSALLAAGLAVQVVCCVLALMQVPRTQLGPAGPVETGSEGLMVIGILGFGLGGVLSLTGVIGFGVLLGMRAHAED